MQPFFLLDEVATKDKTYTGIVDFVSTKYIIFYDVTMNSDPSVIKVIVLWRMYYQHMRFSVFKEMYFRSLNIGDPVMINKKTVTNGVFEKSKVRKKTVKLLPNNTV